MTNAHRRLALLPAKGTAVKTRQSLAVVLALMALLALMPAGPAQATDECVGDITNDPSRPVWILAQKVARNDTTTITNIRGLSVDLTTDSPSLHETFLYSRAYSRQALRIQSNASNYIEFGWAYTRIVPQGGHQRRVYYIDNRNGLDPSPHYGGAISAGKYIFQLYNLPSGYSSYPDQFVMSTVNLANGSVVTHWVRNPAYDLGTAISSITESDSCNEAAIRTANSYYYPNAAPYTGRKVGYNSNAAWWIHIDQNTHWGMSWTGVVSPFEEWYTYCKYPKGCTQ